MNSSSIFDHICLEHIYSELNLGNKIFKIINLLDTSKAVRLHESIPQ